MQPSEWSRAAFCSKIPAMEMKLDYPPFLPPRWLRNAHLQTIVASHRPRRWRFGWTTWEPITIDLGASGKIVAEASWQPGSKPDSPALVLLHGLEGSARSHHLLGMSKKGYEAGFHTIRMNMRNCGGTEHLTPTLYCAALSEDVLAAVRHLQTAFGIAKAYAAGVSLGGNLLLKFLGEQGERGTEYLQGAGVMSTPIDLDAGARALDHPRNRIYQRHFVRQLIARVERKAAFFPTIADLGRLKEIRSIRQFDDVVTGPHFGFGSAENYYRAASAEPLLGAIRVPTLLIQSMDDPLIPFESYRNSELQRNPFLELLATEHGGHAGFLAARRSAADLDCYWAECRIIQFLQALASPSPF